MSLSCPLCSEALADQSEYVRHLADAHGLVDDPGTSSDAATLAPEPEPEPEPERELEAAESWSALPPLEITPSRSPFEVLAPGERALATLPGGRPAGTDAAVAAGVLGGAVGALILHSVRGKRTGEGPAGRALSLTTQRFLMFEFGELIEECPLQAVASLRAKKSSANRKWRVLEVKVNGGGKMRIESNRESIEAFMETARKSSPKQT